jgi:O-antigen ligase
VFYEASSFGNCCAIFLVAASAAYLSGQERAVRIRHYCLPFFISVLGLGVFLCFSRSVWASVLVSLVVFAWVSGMVKLHRVWLFLAALLAPLILVWLYFPQLWGYFTGNRIGYFGQILADPNLVSSGRVETWATLFSILRQYPQYLLFGVGYKTLPFTRLFHQEIVTDNGFLNLLVETGLLGLGGFLIFSTAILKSFWALTRRTSGIALFWSALVLSLWFGEWVQMLATDAYTYWRSMAVLVALTALVLNRTDRSRVGKATLRATSGIYAQT